MVLHESLFGGFVDSATSEDQILISTAPEWNATGEKIYISGRSKVTHFPHENDPIKVLAKFAGTVEDYLQDLLLDSNVTKGMRDLIADHVKQGRDYISVIEEHEKGYYTNMPNT